MAHSSGRATSGDVAARCVRLRKGPAPEPARVESHRDIALFFDCANVDAACAVRSRGLNVPDPVVRDYGMKQLYFHDPDGYEICLQHPVE